MSSYPAKFGKYLLLERVNVGGMAEVFKAKAFGAAGFERILAIKRILPNLVEDDEFVKMFIDEARIAVQLTHANIVQIFELGRHGDHYYIAMEYLASRDMRGILDRMRANGQLMPIPQACYITAKVCEGLDYAHKRRDANGAPMNIIHRDVSPQNILIGFEGEVKVIDFGIAKAANRASKTQAGVLKGKFGYMSPEQVRGLPIDRRSDIFAVGVLLYEMLTGERLFIGESDFSTLERVRNAEVTPPTSFNKKITPQLEQIVLKALAREVEDRFQWSADLAEELQPFLIEDKQVFNMKRLALLMKEAYGAEISLERQKAEEFRRITAEDAKPERGGAQSSILPLHGPSAEAPIPPKSPPPAPPPKPVAKPPVDEDAAADEAAGEFGEDKTFVIEASAAGMALQNQVTEDPERPQAGAAAKNGAAGKNGAAKAPAVGAEGSSTGRRPPSRPENTNDDYLDQVSLYGDDSSSEDDSRTLVSAPNPFFDKGGTNQADPTGEEDDEIDASEAADEDDAARSPHTRLGGELSDAPTMMAVDRTGPGVQPAGENSATRTAYRGDLAQPAVRASAVDPVAAAMAEEERLAAEIVRGASRGAPPPPTPRGNDVAGRQLPAVERTVSGPASPPPATTTGVAAGPADAAALPPPPHTLASLPKNLNLIVMGAVAFSLVLFVAVTTAGLIRYLRAQETTLTLYAVGAPPPSNVKVTIDGTPVGGLPSSAKLRAGEHTIVVEGSGMVPVTRTFTGAGGTAKQPVLIVPSAKVAAAPADPVEPTPGAGSDPSRPVAAADPAVAPTPAAAKPASAGVSGGWRLSVAAVADDTGTAIAGAEVFVDGVAVGHTPFEGEIDPAASQIDLQIKKSGYVTRSLRVDRGDRVAVGPATVRLPPGSEPSATPPPGDPTAAVTPPPPADPAPVAKPPATPSAVSKPPADKPVAPVDKPPVAAKPPTDKPKPTDKPTDKPSDKTPSDKTPSDKTPSDKTPADAGKALAQLQIGTQPFAETYVDGKLRGATPFYGKQALKLSVGPHKVDFVDKATGKKFHYRITIQADDPDNKAVIILGKPDMLPKVQGKIAVKSLD